MPEQNTMANPHRKLDLCGCIGDACNQQASGTGGLKEIMCRKSTQRSSNAAGNGRSETPPSVDLSNPARFMESAEDRLAELPDSSDFRPASFSVFNLPDIDRLIDKT